MDFERLASQYPVTIEQVLTIATLTTEKVEYCCQLIKHGVEYKCVLQMLKYGAIR